MKINEPGRLNGLHNYSKAGSRKAEGAIGARKATDQVSISQEAQELLQAGRAGQAERTEKISALKQSVSSGTYYVEAGKLAESILPYLR